jgi:DNA-binding transcriptional MerR regulator
VPLDKSPDAFRTISEVADHLDTPAHVLRFWESRFPQIRPVKRAGGRRYYRPSDVALLQGIRRLLHDEGMTIRGVQKVLREQGVRHVASLGGSDVAPEVEGDDAIQAPAPPPQRQQAARTAPRQRPALLPSEEEQEPLPDVEPTATFAGQLRSVPPSTLRGRAMLLAASIARLEALRERLAERGRVPRR